MNRTIKIIVAFLITLTALYFVFHDKPLDKNLVTKIGPEISLNTSALKECANDSIIVDFEKFKECGNDPTTYLYADTWTSDVKNQLLKLGFKTILLDSDSFKTSDSIPRISITCYLKDNDLLTTKIVLHFIYQKYLNYRGDNILVNDIVLKLKNDKWSADT